MPPPSTTSPTTAQCKLRTKLAVERYRDLTMRQLSTLLGYSLTSGLLKKSVRELANDGEVSKANSIPKRADHNGIFPQGVAPHVVSALEEGRSTGRRDPRRESKMIEHTIDLNDVLIALELFGTQTP